MDSSSHKKRTLLFLINPRAGTRGKKRVERLIHERVGSTPHAYEIVYTKAPQDATRLSEESKADVVVAVGGDGTVNEVCKGLVGGKGALGILPTGSGNGVARHLKIPIHPPKALERLLQFRTKTIDTVSINDAVFLGAAGIGFDAHIAWKFADLKRRGFWSYLRLIIKEYAKYRPQSYNLVVDGKPIKRKALLISFANSSQYGNNFQIAPHAKLDDGYLDLAILDHPPDFALSEIVLRMIRGSIHKSKYYKCVRCKEVTVQNKNLHAHIDGEPAFFQEPLEITIHPQSLHMLY